MPNRDELGRFAIDLRNATVEDLRAARFEPGCGTSRCFLTEHWFGPDGFNPYGVDRSNRRRDGQRAHLNGVLLSPRSYSFDELSSSDSGDDDDDSGDDDDYEHDSDCDCSACETARYRDDPGRELIRSYSYTPLLDFRGDKAPYYGMEVEVTTDRPGKAATLAQSYAGDLIYCKEDGSVQGLEMVTHPMSYDWAMGNFPWDLLPTLSSEAEASIVPQENGIHVHVGRDGFSDSAHMYRWMKLWYRNPSDIQRIARRGSNHWGAFDPEHRASHAEAVKYGKPSYRRQRDNTRFDRYSAINTLNPDTLEVRVFASTLRPRRAKAALQLVAGSVEYARQLTANAITHRRGWDWQAFIAWTAKDGRYPDLLAENRVRRPGRYASE